MIRLLDVCFSILGLICLSPVLLMIVVIGFFDTGSPIFRQIRVGRGQKKFVLIKFRTMNRGTQSVATHLVGQSSVTRWGMFLRKTKLDELPQLVNVLLGQMSIVGPRPCLYSQIELMEARRSLGVDKVRPGITGLAQVSGIDMSNPIKLARLDKQMIETMSVKNYFLYIVKTASGSGSGDRINTNL